jgi:transglutaminase-like putative cysteine protease
MVQAVRRDFSYNRRDKMGTQDPLDTLHSGIGTCRDFALFLMEAVRSLGFAARFVSDCLYDGDRADDGEETSAVGDGAMHAWPRASPA